MNKFIANVFGGVLDFINGVVVLLLLGRVGFCFLALESQREVVKVCKELGLPEAALLVTDNFWVAGLQSFVALLLYSLFVGLLSIFVSMHEQLSLMNDQLEESKAFQADACNQLRELKQEIAELRKESYHGPSMIE